jgi:putative hydroxymethylpyrimidine transporter CytX
VDTEQRTFSTFKMMVLWFGVSISIAEVFTGTLLAPLGFREGFVAILVGHVIGGVIQFLAGLIGAKSGLSATQTFRISFGRYGSYAFSILNIMQLLGWTAVMIISGAKALDGITGVLIDYRNETLWCIVIGCLILIWISRSLTGIFKAHALVVAALFLCLLILGYNVFTQPGGARAVDLPPLTFGQAVELNVAMCLSWLPLISDYSRILKHPLRGTLAGVVCYSCGGILMFTIGLGAALYAGATEISVMLLSAGLGVPGLFVIAFSTVVCTFLDAHSSGVSAANISQKVNEKLVGICVVILGTTVAIFVPISQYENFLYLIGSVFSPLFAVLLIDVYLFGRRDINYAINCKNLLLWLAGFIMYRTLMGYDFILGVTFPVMFIIGGFCFAVNTAVNRRRKMVEVK